MSLTEKLENAPSPRAAGFITWLDDLLECAERAAGVGGLETLFETERVFGSDDDHGYYPGRYGW